MSDLTPHLETGASHVCRAWLIRRVDGYQIGFTDHDYDLTFDGITFQASAGMSALAVQQTTGLSVDNAETLGALSSSAIAAADIAAGFYDGAEVLSWLVRWDAPHQRQLQFRGSIGEITRTGTSFSAELRGQTQKLNQPGGRVYHRLCPAVLGDGTCGIDLNAAGLHARTSVVRATQDAVWVELSAPAKGWFEAGSLVALGGAVRGSIRTDTPDGALRRIELWEPMAEPLDAGTVLLLTAGCDKRFDSCRAKFDNAANFQGFPHIPGEDWLMAVPRSEDVNDGGSMFG